MGGPDEKCSDGADARRFTFLESEKAKRLEYCRIRLVACTHSGAVPTKASTRLDAAPTKASTRRGVAYSMLPPGLALRRHLYLTLTRSEPGLLSLQLGATTKTLNTSNTQKESSCHCDRDRNKNVARMKAHNRNPHEAALSKSTRVPLRPGGARHLQPHRAVSRATRLSKVVASE